MNILKNEEFFGSYYIDRIKDCEKEGLIKDLNVDEDFNSISFHFYCTKQFCNSCVTIVLADSYNNESKKNRCIRLYSEAIRFIKKLKILI